MHRPEERDDRRHLGGAEVLPVGGHVAAALENLAHQLIVRQARRDVVQRGTALPALATERVTVPALLALQQQRALQLERRAVAHVLDRHRRGAPRLHVRRPGGGYPQPGERREGQEDERDPDDGHGPAQPALLARAGDERQREQRDDPQHGSGEDEERLRPRRQEREQREEREEVEIGPRRRADDGGIGLAVRSEGPEDRGAGEHGADRDPGERDVALGGIREERHAVALHLLLVLAAVGRPVHEPAGHGPLVDAEAEHQQQVDRDEGDQEPRHHEDVQREEARQRLPRDDRAAEQQVHHLASQQRRAPHDRRADAEAPVGVLIEAQHLAGERHPEGAEEQEDAGDPGQLARVLVGAEEEHLRHVDAHHGDHEVRAPAVHRAQVPAERLLVVQHLEALPGAGGRGHVDRRQADAGDHLDHEQDERSAAEDIPPARGLARDAVPGHLGERRADSEPLIEPLAELAQHLRRAPTASGAVRPAPAAARPVPCTGTDRADAAAVRRRGRRWRSTRRRDTGT